MRAYESGNRDTQTDPILASVYFDISKTLIEQAFEMIEIIAEAEGYVRREGQDNEVPEDKNPAATAPAAKRPIKEKRGLLYYLNGKTALDLAYRNGYANIVSLLLKKEIVQPLKEQQGHSDKTVLQKKLNKKLLDAVYTDNMGGVEEALSLGADVNAADDDGWTPLIYAAYRGNTDITILLLKYRTNINAVDKYGNTALMTVCWRGNTDMVKLLLRYGADINIVSNDGNTALINACRKGYTDIARLLIEHGADINIINSTGLTALDILKGYHPKKYKK